MKPAVNIPLLAGHCITAVDFGLLERESRLVLGIFTRSTFFEGNPEASSVFDL